MGLGILFEFGIGSTFSGDKTDSSCIQMLIRVTNRFPNFYKSVSFGVKGPLYLRKIISLTFLCRSTITDPAMA